jgi:hypothetical protein
MTSPPVAVLDVLNSLLEAEQNSVFRFMGEGSPYLSRATADVRRPLNEMVEANLRHSGELAGLVESLGGFPAPRSLRSEEQYLAFLSLKFLLPKLVTEKELILRRYDNAIRSLTNVAPPQVLTTLKRIESECRGHLATLQKVSDDVIAAGKVAARRAESPSRSPS